MTRVRTHPGEMLKEEFLIPLGLGESDVAADIGVPVGEVTAVVSGRGSVSADFALRLARRFGTTPQLWLNLQNAFDLSAATAANDYSSVKPFEAAE